MRDRAPFPRGCGPALAATLGLLLFAATLRAELRFIRPERIAPPAVSDREFVADVGEGLDTDCSFEDFEFEIEVTRWVGETDESGHVRDVEQRIANGVLTAFARLDVASFDVDSEADCSRSVFCNGPEVDRIWINGHLAGELAGGNEQWSRNSFVVPIEHLRFARRDGGRLIPAKNTVRVEVDVLHPRNRVWCTAIDWGSLRFGAMSPVVLVHGNNSDGGFFARRGLAGSLAHRHVTTDDDIDLPTASIADNARALDAELQASVAEYGVDSIHLVAHSKGGLDLRGWFASYLDNGLVDYDVLSYTTLGTPHRGSILADMVVLKTDLRDRGARVEFVNEPLMAALLARLTTADPGTRDLTTESVASFNRSHPSLPESLLFNAIAADADRDGDDHVSVEAGEVWPLQEEEPLLVLLEKTLGRLALGFTVDRLYQTLLWVRSFRAVESIDRKGRPIVTLVSVSDGVPHGNDVLVSLRSALASGGIGRSLASSRTYTGADGRNHAGLGDDEVGRQVYSWLRRIARRLGDMKSFAPEP